MRHTTGQVYAQLCVQWIVHLDFLPVLIADIVAFVAILLLLLIPTLFISKVDPAETVRVK